MSVTLWKASMLMFVEEGMWLVLYGFNALV